MFRRVVDLAGSVLGTIDVVVVFELGLGFGFRVGKESRTRRNLDDGAFLLIVDEDAAVFAIAPQIAWEERAIAATIIGVGAGAGDGGECRGTEGRVVLTPELASRNYESLLVIVFLLLVVLTVLQRVLFDRVHKSGVVAVDNVVVVVFRCCGREVGG
jgi:hypothetical protein